MDVFGVGWPMEITNVDETIVWFTYSERNTVNGWIYVRATV